MDKLLSGRRVLVVEDEMLVLLMIEDMLADLGCESVIAAASVTRALASIDAQFFDLAMLDMNLNGDKTYSVADALPARGIPFVFSTGYNGHHMRDGYSDRPVLKKPFTYKDLDEMLGRLLSS
jgi:CheY-like chemotaxis protein